MGPKHILLSVNGEKLPVPSSYEPSTRLIDVLRCESKFKGPKVGCGEGGCGACTVIVDRLDPVTGAISRVTLNSCLAPIGSLDGAAIITAEGLGNSKTGFSPAQEAMAKRFGSQCGYCSPGMVVAMTAAAAACDGSSSGESAAAAVAGGVDGNLCRCTGWRPIIDACRDIADLEDLHKYTCTNNNSSSSSSASSAALLPPPEATYPHWLRQYVISKHRHHQQQQWLLGGVSSSSSDGGQVWLSPTSLSELAAVLRQAAAEGCHPHIVAGNTGSGVFSDLWPGAAAVVVDLAAVRDLKCVEQQQQQQQQGIKMGAMVTIQELIHILKSPSLAAAGASNGCKQHNTGGNAGPGTAALANLDSSSSSSRCAAAGSHEPHCSGGGQCKKSSSNQGWSPLVDHLERIAGVHVRSAATLGGHFGLCARKPLQTDLGLLLAAAGAQLQIMTVRTATTAAHGYCSNGGMYSATAAADGNAYPWQSIGGSSAQSGWQQQQQHYELHWVSVEEYLDNSCIGARDCSSSSSSSDCSELTAEAVAGAKLAQGPPCADTTAAGSSSSHGMYPAVPAAAAAGGSDDVVHEIITAVWLPYIDETHERFWSYKVALRHVNSHALVNAACWFRFEQANARSSSQCVTTNSSDSALQQQLQAQADPSFAGCKIVSARVFVGFSPEGPQRLRYNHSSSSSSRGFGSSLNLEPWRMCRVPGVESVITGAVMELKVISSALRELNSHPTSSAASLNPTGFQSQTLQGIIFKALVPLLNPNSTSSLNPRVQRLLLLPKPYNPRVLPEGRQVIPGAGEESRDVVPVHLPVEKESVRLQLSGEAEYAADVAVKMNGRVLSLAGVLSSEALAYIDHIETSTSLMMPGVVGVITAHDVPGANKVFDAPLLADGRVEYVGQLVALVAARSQAAADRAAAAVKVSYRPIPGQQPIITIDQAVAAGSFHNDMPQMHAHVVRQQQQQQQQKLAPPGCIVSSSSSSNINASSLCNHDEITVEDLIAAAPHQITAASYTLPAQQHMYMEPPTAVAEPREDGCFRVTSSTQSLDAVQQAVAAVLGAPFNKITVIAKRLGGAFGGKVSRSMFVAAAAAALAAAKFDQAVCYTLSRRDDLMMNHGRCLGRVTYDVGFDQTGKVHAVKAKVIYRAGAYIDLASNDGSSLVTASDSAYDLSGLSVDVLFAKCNIPPHTIVRAPGFLQGVMVMEQVMEHVAAVLGKDSAAVKAANFLQDDNGSRRRDRIFSSSSGGSGERVSSNMGRLCIGSADMAAGKLSKLVASTGQITQEQQQQQSDDQPLHGVTTVLGRYISSSSYTLPLLWQQLLSSSQYESRLSAVHHHNRHQAWSKRGLVVTPVRFDCSPAAVCAAVSVYADGSVLVTHGGVEMGQGLTTKVKQAAVAALSALLPGAQRPLPLAVVRVAASSSGVVPNGGPTWSSTGSEGNCQAVMNAAEKLVKKLTPHLKVQSDAESTWKATIASLYSDAVGFAPSNVMLSAYGYFGGTVKQGASKQPVQYSAFGAAVTEVELDVLTGERRVLSTHIKYDCGYPLNPAIDLGQIEGGFVMGLGVMLSEEVVINEITGVTMTASTWKYKIPTIDLIPQQFVVEFGDWPNPRGILSSKASGEPAVMASTSALMALQQAAAAAVVEVQGLGVLEAGQCGHSNSISSSSSTGTKSSKPGFVMLCAPATPQRLKGVIGGFDLAGALDAAQADSQSR